MVRTTLLYSLAVAAAAFALVWLDYQYARRAVSTEFYVVLVAAAFTGLGLWLGARLTTARRAPGFERNEAALESLGLTAREYEVLERLAAGRSNKEIARELDLSPNTVKSHVSRLYEKLEAKRRTEAVDKARGLALIP